HVDSRMMAKAAVLSNVGARIVGAAYNGPHSANGIASLFIATGQDEANVVESHAGHLSHELLENDDLYLSVTLPSLIVATYGGGTGLPTQKECLNLLGCYGKG
ncbi:hydroxymethylglutaryl-CoA reductase, partial [Bowmanella dokdonensis]|nr:hydroxymethylglutaryl-CoA reductase [Bowmanella dokdonensis]